MVTPLENDRLLRALRREPVDVTPIWIMRQAGRYLPEYRKTRASVGNFLTLCKTPELACEVTLQPLERFPLDAAILFSDILTIPDAMGLGLNFDDSGLHFTNPVQTSHAIHALAPPDPALELAYVTDAIKLIKRELNGTVPLIGFAGSPWTLATYMVEGGSSKIFARVKDLMYSSPSDMHHLLAVLAESVTHYLNAQIAAGVDVVMIFDTWGGILTPPLYREFSLQYMQEIIMQLARQQGAHKIPVILFTKGGGNWIEDIAATGCDAVGVDWGSDLTEMRKKVGQYVALQGNLDPCVLYADEAVIRKEVSKVLAAYGQGSGHVFNLGHGIHPQIKPEHVAILVDAVHECSRPYHKQ